MPPLAIKAAGMVTAVGFNAPACLSALRAGIRNVNRTNLWDKYSGQYLAAGKVPLPQWWVGLAKLVPAQNIPVLLGVAPPDRPFRFSGLDTEMIPEIEQRLGFHLHTASRVI